MKNAMIDWATRWMAGLVMILVVVMVVLVGIACFQAGMGSADVSCDFRVGLFRADLEIANTKLERLSGLERVAKFRDFLVIYVAHHEEIGKQTVMLIGPDSIQIGVN